MSFRNRFSGQTVDEIVAEVTEVSEESSRVPEVLVQVPGRVRDDHGLAAGPVVVEQSGIGKSKY